MFSFESAPLSRKPNFTRARHAKPTIGEDEMDWEDGNFQDNQVVIPGEDIAAFQSYMRGHGTYVENQKVVSSVAGTVERVNKLISVLPISSRYSPEVGDLVVGRISEVQSRRWKVDLSSKQDAILMLASVNLPGGVQRRKLESDELQMRTYFEEGDLLVAEVQQVMGDGSCWLHTRSLRYGKLRNGTLVKVDPILIQRLKSHFFSLPCGVDIILGLNGFIWISKHVKETEQVGEEGFDAQAIYSNKNDVIDDETRRAIIVTSAVIHALGKGFIPITDAILIQAYEWAVDHVHDRGGSVKELFAEDLGNQLVLAASSWINL